MMSILVLVLSSFANDGGYQFDSDVPLEIQKQITTDLIFIKTLKGSVGSSLHQQIFKGPTATQNLGVTYDKFFSSHMNQIGLDDCGNPNAVACVKPTWFTHRKLNLTHHYIQDHIPQIARLSILFHEARHGELSHGGWTHAKCPKPFLDSRGQPKKSIYTGAPLEGEPACDKTPLGSYGLAIVMLKNIQKNCTNCNSKIKMDAELYGDDQMGRIIDSGATAQLRQDLYARNTTRAK